MAADNAMPRWLEAGVKLLLEILGHISLKLEAIEGDESKLDCLALHVVGHVSRFDDDTRLPGGRDVARGRGSRGRGARSGRRC